MIGDNEAKRLWVIGHQVTPMAVGGKIAAVDVVLTPGVPGPPPHHHPGSAEYFWMISGRLDVMAGENWTSLGPEDYFVVPPDAVHTFRMAGDEEVRFVTGWEPGGFEQFFLDCGVDASLPGSFEQSMSGEVMGKAIEALTRHAVVPPGVLESLTP
jgi:quercetin dioxygenase-like cupin family protein